jgi:signal transduction histidine kinase
MPKHSMRNSLSAVTTDRSPAAEGNTTHSPSIKVHVQRQESGEGEPAVQRTALLELMNTVSRTSISRLSGATDFRSVMIEMLRAAADVLSPLGVSGIGLVRYNPGTKCAYVAAHLVNGIEQAIAGSDLDGDWPVDSPAMSVPWRRVQKEDFVWGLTSDPEVLIPAVREYHESLGARAVAYIPLKVRDKTTGFIGFDLTSETPPGPQQIEVIKMLTSQVSLAAEMERLANDARDIAIAREQEKAAQSRAAELASVNLVLTSSLARLSGSSEMHDFLAHVIGEIVRVTRASNAAVTRYDAKSNTLALELFHDGQTARWGMSQNEIALWGSPYNADVTPAFQIGLREPRMFVASLYDGSSYVPIEEFALPGGLQWMESIGASDAAVCILRAGNQPVGTFHLHFTGGRVMRPEDLPLLESLSQQAAIALRLVGLAEEARASALAGERENEAVERAAQLARRDSMLAAVVQFSQALVQPGSLAENMPGALRYLLKVDGVSRVIVGRNEITPSGDLVNYYLWEEVLPGYPLQKDLPGCNPIRASDFPDQLAAFEAGEAFQSLAEDMSHFGSAMQNAVHAKAILMVPVYVRGKWWGIVGFDNCVEARKWSDPEVQVLKGVAAGVAAGIAREEAERAVHDAQAAIVVEREKTAQQRASEAKRISDFLVTTVSDLSSGSDLSRVLESIVAGLARALDAAHVFLFRHDSESRRIRLHLTYTDGNLRWGMSGAEMPLFAAPFPDDITPAWRIMCERRGLFTPEITPIPAEQFGWPGALDYAARFELSDIGHIVLFSGDAPVGSIGIGLRNGRLISSDKPFIEAVAQQAAVAIRLVDLAEEARQSAIAVEQEKATREQAEELARANAAFQSIVDVVSSVGDLDQFIPSALQTVRETFDAQDCAFWEHDGELIRLRYWLWKGKLCRPDELPNLDAELRQTLQVFLDGFTMPTEDARQMKRARVADHVRGTHIPAFSRFALAYGWELELAVPMVAGGVAIGFMSIYRKLKTPFTRSEINLAEALCRQLALALQASRLAEAARSRAVELAVTREQEMAAQERVAELAKANAAITGSLRQMANESDLSRTPGLVLLEICKHAGARACCWFDYDAHAHTLQVTLRGRDCVLLTRPDADDPQIFAGPFAADTTPAFALLTQTDEIVELSAPEHVGNLWPGVMDWHRRHGREAMFAYAVKLGDQPIGVLGLGFDQKPHMSQSGKELIRALANHLALSVHGTRQSKKASLAATLDERNRIAREIHDSLAQHFTGILMQLQASAKFASKNPDVARACIVRAESMARDGLKEARRSVMALAQPGEQYQDLPAAVRALVETATADTGTQSDVVIIGTPHPLNPHVAVNFLRVCQEALANAQRYAKASLISVKLTFAHTMLHMEIKDDGIGFSIGNIAGSGLGLTGMKARADRISGSLSVVSRPGHGTTVLLQAPISHGEEVRA